MDKQKEDLYYMDLAERAAANSYCVRLKVGALIVKRSRILSDGFNGTVSGRPNICECEDGSDSLKEVVHAEANAICKLARETGGGRGATMYTLYAPCLECAKLILSSGIVRLVYKHPFRDPSGLDLIKSTNRVKISQFKQPS